MTSNPTIEEVWQDLRRLGGDPLQRRVDANHPHDLYLDFEPPSRPGFVAVCSHQPPGVRPLRAVTVEDGRRTDGRWSLRLSLDEPRLFPVFAARCHDIVEFTRAGTSESHLGAAVIGRLDQWRTLLERDASGLFDTELRGLIGELSVLESIFEVMSISEAVAAWTGPLGTPQDFILPTGHRIEVKAARRLAKTVKINGLAQLDADSAPLTVAVVRIEDTGASAPEAVSAPQLVDRICARITHDPEALATFLASLSFLGWSEHPRHHALIVRIVSIDCYLVGPDFPKLTRATVPLGVDDAHYTILLPVDLQTFERTFQ